jgi:hypothetical protein
MICKQHGKVGERAAMVFGYRQPAMRFENISNDLKCILFEKYGFLFLKSPIHVYQ